ncbi:hypothetical protein [Leptospira abararensis]|uniref:hypothetical protein n=1 Tax=Leptospira abararensis TaxID=2810036 RepID=UPI001E30C7A4|nr:hypothetical protein [Leptospira abararensis]
MVGVSLDSIDEIQQTNSIHSLIDFGGYNSGCNLTLSSTWKLWSKLDSDDPTIDRTSGFSLCNLLSDDATEKI